MVVSRFRSVAVGVLAWGLLGLPVTWAQEKSGDASGSEDFEDFAQIPLEELLDTVVSSARHEQDIAESPSAITVITREQIENTGCSDVICLLRLVPEVDVFRTTPVFSGLGARSMSDLLGDRVLALLDGREINNDFYGFPLYQALEIHLEDIERIEVIRGPGSAVYGANAHSLVISITSRKTVERTGEVFVGAGEHGRLSLHARLGTQYSTWNLLLAGGVDNADHWTVQGQDARDTYRLRLQASREEGEVRTDLQAGFVTLEGDFYADIAPLEVRDGFRGYLLLNHQNDWLQARLALDMMRGSYTLDLPLFFQGMKVGQAPDEMSALNTGVDAEVLIKQKLFEGNLLIAGVNYRWITLIAEDNDPDWVNQHRGGVFIQDEQRLAKRLTLTLGVRLDVNNITPLSVSPRAAGVYRFADDQFLRLAFGMAFRKPTIFNTSLHLEGFKGEPAFPEVEEFFKRSIGNDKIENESITALEAGYIGRFLDKRLTAEAVLFMNFYRKPITSHLDIVLKTGLPDLSEGASVFVYDNSGRESNAVGGSASLTYRIGTGFRVNLNYTYRHSWYIKQSFSKRNPGEPAHLLKGALHYISPVGLRTGVAMFYRSYHEIDINEHGSPFDRRIDIPLPAHVHFNAFVSWREAIGSGWLEIGVRAYNILNATFQDQPSVIRTDGTEMGGSHLSRRIFLFVRGTL